MKEDELQKISKLSSSIKLSLEEKTRLKENIISQMKAVELRQLRGGITSHRFQFGRFLVNPRMAYAALALVFVLSTGSVLAAAGNSLPGNPLYPIKVSVNERVQGMFLTSVASKAQREIELMNRRFEEAHSLALAEDLTVRNREIIEEQIEKHTDRVRSYIEVSERDQELGQVIDLQTKLEVSLDINEKILTSIEPISKEVTPVINKIRSELSNIYLDKSTLQNSLQKEKYPSLAVVAGERMRVAESLLNKTETLFNQKNIDPATKNYYLNQLLDARRKLEEGQTLLKANFPTKALGLFEQVVVISSEIHHHLEDLEENIIRRGIVEEKLNLGRPQIEPVVPLQVSPGSVKGANTKASVEANSRSKSKPSVAETVKTGVDKLLP